MILLSWFLPITLFGVILSESSSEPSENSTLVLLHVLFRHGNRTPDKVGLYPNDPHLNETYEPFGYSQLTKKGKKTMYDLGQYLRNNYNDFIPNQYTPNLVKAISTNMKRTKMSLQLVLAGLFPPQPSDIFIEGFNWQPVPFDIEQAGVLIGVSSLYCPIYIHQYYGFLGSEQAASIIHKYKVLYNFLTENSGLKVEKPKDAAKIYFTLKSEDDFGLKLPKWTSTIYPNILEEAASVDYEIATATPIMKKLTAGLLLKKILEDSVAQNEKSETKVYLYSAHEFNIATMLRTLNVFYRHIPPFGATILFEIHKINETLGLKLFYQDYKGIKPKILTIPGCAQFCPLEKIYVLLKDHLPGKNDVCSISKEVM